VGEEVVIVEAVIVAGEEAVVIMAEEEAADLTMAVEEAVAIVVCLTTPGEAEVVIDRGLTTAVTLALLMRAPALRHRTGGLLTKIVRVAATAAGRRLSCDGLHDGQNAFCSRNYPYMTKFTTHGNVPPSA
jgi:hypothetical protein